MIFENLSQKLSNVFKKLRSKGKLTVADVDSAMREIKIALLGADVSYAVVKKFISRVSELAVGADVLESLTPDQQVIKIVNNELAKLMGSENNKPGVNFASNGPTCVMICGLQGSGKTTHCAKLAHFYATQGHRPMLVACDTYRPAAISQLQTIGKKAKAYVFFEEGKTPVEIAQDSLPYAKDYGYDLVIFDTAGRLHIDEELMNELEEMKAKVSFNEILLVVDSMMGQDAVNVAKKFNDQLEIDGVILTKLDGDSRGGAAISVLDVTGKPIKFAGTGEKLGDFELFKPDRIASRILGMGDVLTLIEKAQKNIEFKDAEKMANKLKNSSFDMDDLLNHMKQIEKMGSIRKIVEMIPGISNKIKDADLESGEDRMLKTQAIISSMTKQERKTPTIIDFQRKKRISAGSGTTVADVNILLKQFVQMQKFFKQFGNKKGFLRKGLMTRFKPR